MFYLAVCRIKNLRYCIGRDKLKDGKGENSERIRRNKISRKLGDKVSKRK